MYSNIVRHGLNRVPEEMRASLKSKVGVLKGSQLYGNF